MTFRVHSISAATPVSRVLRLSLDGARFAYRAGQAAALGIRGRVERKPYSIANAPDDSRARGCLEFLVKIDGDTRIGAALVALAPGARVTVGGPLGSFVFPRRVTAKRLAFVAGGTGIAPLRAMLQHALARGYAGRVSVLYSARSPRHLAFADELRRLARQGRIRLRVRVTRQAPRGWRGGRGRLGLRHLRAVVPDSRTLCFVCGPSAFVANVLPLLRRLTVPPGRIRMESWRA